MMLGQGGADDRYISIVQISPFNYPDPRRRYVVIKAYFDGSGKADNHNSRVVTLGDFSGSAKAWELFRPKWEEVLRNSGSEYWHTADAMMCANDFSRPDWDADRAIVALDSIVDLICEVSSYRVTSEERLRGHIGTVFLDDYQQSKTDNPYLRTAEAVCVNGAVGPVVHNPEYSTMRIYFDQNESFKRELYRVWEKGRARTATIQREWALKVEVVCDLDSRKYYELQLADALAWIANKSHLLRLSGAPESLTASASARVVKILGATFPDYTVFDSGGLIRAYPRDAEKYRYYTHVMAFGNKRDRAALQAEDPESYAQWLETRSGDPE